MCEVNCLTVHCIPHILSIYSHKLEMLHVVHMKDDKMKSLLEEVERLSTEKGQKVLFLKAYNNYSCEAFNNMLPCENIFINTITMF